MKDILLLLVLLNALSTKVCSEPYQADSDGKCLDPATEYLFEESGLCCKKCPAGHRMKQECSETTETVCEQCPLGQFMERINYSPNCLSCKKCKAVKGLQYAQNCSSTTKSQCECQPGMYCIMEFDDPYCSACSKYKPCKLGYGVSVPGRANSDVKCQQCPDGTFSDTVSYTDPCRPHTQCHGRVVREGDATADTVCKPEAFMSNTVPQTSTREHQTQIEITTASAMMNTFLATSDSNVPRELTDYYTPSIGLLPSVPETVFNHSTKSPPPNTVSDSVLAIAIGSVIGFILIFIAIILLCRCTSVRKKDALKFHPKVDANGNCENGDKINQGYYGETQLTSFTVTSPEQQCLLETGEGCSDQSQCSTNTETLTRTDGCSSCESIGPLQSTVALHNPHSALSEPLTLLSNTEPVARQTSVITQSSCSSQPTSPLVLSPVSPSPHVNVNITFHIGNSSGGTPSVIPADLTKVDPKLPFGEEEESFSIPQQEAGKQSLMSVQESESYSA